MESGVSWRSGDFTWYLVQEEGGQCKRLDWGHLN